MSWTMWELSVIIAIGRLKQVDYRKSKASLGLHNDFTANLRYIVRRYLKHKQKQQQHQNPQQLQHK